jgi:hypothetical protein
MNLKLSTNDIHIWLTRKSLIPAALVRDYYSLMDESQRARVTCAFRARNYATLMPSPEPYNALFYLSMQTLPRQSGRSRKMLQASHIFQHPVQAYHLI